MKSKNNTKLADVVGHVIAEREQREAEAKKAKVALVVNDVIDQIKALDGRMEKARKNLDELCTARNKLQAQLTAIRAGDEEALKHPETTIPFGDFRHLEQRIVHDMLQRQFYGRFGRY